MISFVIKVVLLAILLAWTARKVLKWVSGMGGRYGRLASELVRLVDEFARGLGHSMRWVLVGLAILVLVRLAVALWFQPKPPGSSAAPESAPPAVSQPVAP